MQEAGSKSVTIMPQTQSQPPSPLLSFRRSGAEPRQSKEDASGERRGFGGGKPGKRKGGKKRSPALSKSDWGPLGKHPDLDAIVARQRLHLPLSGRITAADVTRAWKSAAAEHHPDRGGCHHTMQLVNGARDLLLGRGCLDS
jgi:hypothetical protein